MKTWTSSEIESFKKMYPIKGKKWCMQKYNKTEAQIRQRAYILQLKQDKTSEFFLSWQKKAAQSKIGKKKPKHAKIIKQYIEDGKYENFIYSNLKHGKSKTKAYKTWVRMMARCYNKKNASYENYGARGIIVCDQWHDFSNFEKWYNAQQINKSIERINVNRNYEPSNCKLANSKEQARNRRTNTVDYDKVEEIRKLYKKTNNQREVARQLNVSYKNVHLIVNGYTWS